MLLPIGKSIWTGKGSFNYYVDKMRVERGGQKISVFVHAQGIKTVRGRVKKWQNSVHVDVECPLRPPIDLQKV